VGGGRSIEEVKWERIGEEEGWGGEGKDEGRKWIKKLKRGGEESRGREGGEIEEEDGDGWEESRGNKEKSFYTIQFFGRVDRRGPDLNSGGYQQGMARTGTPGTV